MNNVSKSSLVLALVLAACGGDGGTPPPPTPVFTTLTVPPASPAMVDGDTVQLTATPLDQNNNPMSLLPAATFTLTSGTSVTVSTSGRVIAQQPGSSVVTASLTSGTTTRTATSTPNVTALGTTANVTASGVTALRIAAAMGNALMAKDLVAAGARINDRDPQGRTALTLARQGKHSHVVKILEGAGAKE